MKNSRIYNLAYHELLTRRGFEEKRLQENPNNQITLNRIKIIDTELKELHDMIIEAEAEQL